MKVHGPECDGNDNGRWIIRAYYRPIDKIVHNLLKIIDEHRNIDFREIRTQAELGRRSSL